MNKKKCLTKIWCSRAQTRVLCYAYGNEMNESNVNSYKHEYATECVYVKVCQNIVPWWNMILDHWRIDVQPTSYGFVIVFSKRGEIFIFSVREFKTKYILAFSLIQIHRKYFTGNFLCLSYEKHTHCQCVCVRKNSIFMVIYLFIYFYLLILMHLSIF